MRKRSLLFAFLSFFAPTFLLADFNVDTPSYINKFKDIAIREMQRSGIPASITLAQAIHESAWGQGTLALKSNNYFGIKCKDYWTGPTYYIEDDDYNAGKLIKSCFRAYDNIENSFVDHSDFLRDNPRYKILFQYALTDYRNWAKGLQKCGYATDKKYAEKLIRTIEQYSLYQFDSLVPPQQVAVTNSPVVAAPSFNLEMYVGGGTKPATTASNQENTSSPAVPTSVATTPIFIQAAPQIPEENYTVPEAVVLPDDYERGTRRSEEVAIPLYLGNAATSEVRESAVSEPAVVSAPPVAIAPDPKPVLPPTPAVLYESAPLVPVVEPAPIPASASFPAPSHTSAPTYAQEQLIPMTYSGDTRAAQLSRRPRVSSNRRR